MVPLRSRVRHPSGESVAGVFWVGFGPKPAFFMARFWQRQPFSCRPGIWCLAETNRVHGIPMRQIRDVGHVEMLDLINELYHRISRQSLVRRSSNATG